MSIDDLRDALKRYEDLERQGKLIKLPCKIGDKIYFIPSKKDGLFNAIYDLNKVYQQKVKEIHITQSGWYVTSDKYAYFGTYIIFDDNTFQKTWFLSEEEAKQKLNEKEANINE